ncbi:MAG: glycosyl hydrolase family 65 protein, partial [Planctomycetota bacterium]
QVVDRNYQDLLEEHVHHWKQRWQSCDIQVTGDADAQQALRINMFHLLRSHPGDDRTAIDAKGYAGDAYCGRFFWDTEIYLLPFFLYTEPQRAQQLMDFRIHSLPGARANARASMCDGARYAWESDHQGEEHCPPLVWQYRDHELHVTADVAYGWQHVLAATGDEDYRRHYAAALLEGARFWLSRIDVVDGTPHLTAVMGPDEYCPVVTDNAFTNRLVRAHLAAAADLGAQHGASKEESERFRDMAERLPLHRLPDGVLAQHLGWEHLAEPDFERTWRDRGKLYGAQVPQEWLHRCKVSKQADVLLLHWLFPNEVDDEELRRAWQRYEPVCCHDSSLSPGVHALIALRLGMHEQAWEFWKRTAFLDLQPGKAAQGIHVACAGATWQLAVFGFAGIRPATSDGCLQIEPRLPIGWQRLQFPLHWRGQALHIGIDPEQVQIQNNGNATVIIRCAGDEVQLESGSSHTWTQRKEQTA